MRRAIETARMLGPFIIDDRLAEVERPWSTTADVPPNLDEQHASTLSFADSLARYLHGNAVEGWEPQNAARARLRAAVNEHGNVIYITHGTLLTLFLSPYLGSTRPMQFWAELASPDVWQLEGSKLTHLREI